MADQCTQEQAVGASMAEEQTGRGRRKGQTRPRDPSRARDEVSEVEARLDRIESHLVVGDDKFDDLNTRLVELGEGLDDTRTELQTALNILLRENRLLKEEMERIKDEFVLFKRVLAQGNGNNPTLSSPAARVDVPKPGVFKGARNAREIDNFLWALEQYFRALEVEEDSRKVDNAPLFLAESAMVWWRRKMMDMEKGTCCIKTWEEFKRNSKNNSTRRMPWMRQEPS
ncbi:hypothetical protein GH714_022168 [Hevea brasiliensis]|uniref:Retrotransposon gag domain-containing protein n=1 Tax=Hevea brasiliensis TaxID=3981 RepID=A0A6A6KTB1_HEVBR|nr:hypothetical protein GH714_022168 [Hevea brasiliensis]